MGEEVACEREKKHIAINATLQALDKAINRLEKLVDAVKGANQGPPKISEAKSPESPGITLITATGVEAGGKSF